MKLLPITPAVDRERAATTDTPRRWSPLLKEPLLHFVVAGILLFGAYQIFNDELVSEVDTQKIELTQDDIRQLAVSWLAQGRPSPTPAQLRNLVDQKVSEEILFREAVALGLDQDDEIIKRRLVQKMDFLAADLATIGEPTNAELAEWFSQNSERFALPPHMKFRHLYFSPDRRGSGVREAAAAALEGIIDNLPDSPELASVADPFMLKSYYGDITPEQMAKEFGPEFANTLFELKPGSWQGPVRSGYGWHLVWIDSIEPGRVPTFDEVGPDVKSAWLESRYREIKRTALAEMHSRYVVVLPPLDDVDLQGLRSSEAASGSSEVPSQ